jgi:hypothetical protein
VPHFFISVIPNLWKESGYYCRNEVILCEDDEIVMQIIFESVFEVQY